MVRFVDITSRGARIDNRCPECIRGGTTSKLFKERTRRVKKGEIIQYYDEDGVKHHHKTDVLIGDWKCSNGHSGTYQHHSLCGVKDCEYSQVMNPEVDTFVNQVADLVHQNRLGQWDGERRIARQLNLDPNDAMVLLENSMKSR